MIYIDGFLIPKAAPIFKYHGATRVVFGGFRAIVAQ
jgi:hypothetical protein